MAIKHGLGTYGNAVGTVTPEDHKLAQAGLVVKDTAGKIRPGLFWEGNETIVTGKANMSYDVARFTAALSRGASSGAVLLANDGVVNVATTAAPGSNSRYDVVYAWQREYSLDGNDSEPVIGVVQGTAAASPSVPSLSAFPGAIELARILVPAGVTATNSGTTITQKAPFTAAAGGVVHFRNATERDAETSLPAGTLGEVSGVLYRWDGATWGPLTDADTLLVSQAFTGASSVSVAGLVGFDAYAIEVQVTGTSVTNMVSMRLQSGGSDDSSANYDSQRVSASGATVAAAAVSAATSWADLQVSPRDLYVMKGTLFGLSSARQTLADLKVIAAASAANLLTVDWGLRHRSTAAFDGITLLPSSGTITGTITVFGKTK